MNFNIGIIGCGLVGKKRADNLGKRGKLIGCYDIDFKKAKNFANDYSVKLFDSIEHIASCKDIDIIIICTLHNTLTSIAETCIKFNKHLLIEKPAGKNYKDVENLRNKLNNNSKIHIGFNHRYHRSIIKAKKIIEKATLGELMFIKASYGHGGRLGYEKEWRFNKEISGGGELIDQGPHLIDLSQWFLEEELELQSSIVKNYFWNTTQEDNAFLTLLSKKGKIVSLHVSCTEWKNTFLFEIYGKHGKLAISGLGGSYGIEKVALYKMSSEMGPPETIIYEYPMLDNSWLIEIEQFYDDIALDKEPKSNLDNAISILKLIDQAYSRNN